MLGVVDEFGIDNDGTCMAWCTKKKLTGVAGKGRYVGLQVVLLHAIFHSIKPTKALVWSSNRRTACPPPETIIQLRQRQVIVEMFLKDPYQSQGGNIEVPARTPREIDTLTSGKPDTQASGWSWH